ncbi:MAG TPA: hypothetical protein VMB48_10970 [Steroidobacteraceae bacterium]|nr:hypothetical protein [Steroidobacteraceae bacterium]
MRSAEHSPLMTGHEFHPEHERDDTTRRIDPVCGMRVAVKQKELLHKEA